MAWSVFPQVLVQGFAADAEVTGHQGFLVACRNSPFQLGNLFAVQRFLSSPVGTALLGQHDSLALTFADQGALELGSLGGCETGIWELRDGAVFDTEVDEVFVVISGGATIELLDEGRSVDVKTGDVMRLTAGTRTRWIVRDHVRKVYLAAG